jgi:ribose 5-phosphate isomerase
MSSKEINKEAVENFIKKYVNFVINKNYKGQLQAEILDFKWFGDNLVVDIHVPNAPDEWSVRDLMKFWDDVVEIGQFAKMVDHELNSINFMPILRKENN